MTRAFVTLDGHPATSAELVVPPTGAWYADVDLEVDPEVTGRVVLELGDLRLSGTVARANDGTRGIQRMTRVVAGAGGWGTLVPAKGYHADNGVAARLVADDAARLAGETIAAFAPSSSVVGKDYVRSTGPASRVLEDVIGAAAWWVDFDGNTRVGSRPTSTPSAEYQVLEYQPRDRVVTFATLELAGFGVGSILTEDLDEPQTIRELRIVANEDTCRVVAWTGGPNTSRGYLADAFARAVGRLAGSKLFGPWRYRVVRMSVDRVELQAVRAGAGLPDIVPGSMWPGMAGIHAQLTPGAEVLVEFIEGDRSMPIVTHFAGKDGGGWAPVSLVLDATTDIKLGKDATQLVALANLVDTELTKLSTTLGTGSNSGGPVAFGTPYVKGPVAATKVKAQ